MSESQPTRPRAGCWILVLPLVAIPTVLSGYALLIWYGYVGIPAVGERVVLDVSTCPEAVEIVRARIDEMGLGSPVYTPTEDGFTAEVTLPDNPFAGDIPATLAKPGLFEVFAGDTVVVSSERVESAILRLDFTGEPSIAIQLDAQGTSDLEAAMRADPPGVVNLRVDGEDMGDRANTPTENSGRVSLPITGPARPEQVARAAQFGLVLGHPLPCAATVTQSPLPASQP